MRDRSLTAFLIVIFSISGTCVLVVSWIRPMLASERAIGTIIGAGGVILAVVLSVCVWLNRRATGF